MAETGIRGVFAAAVTRERKARGWTQDDLARKARLSKSTIVNTERAFRGPSLEVAAMIAAALGMRLGDLTDGEAGDG